MKDGYFTNEFLQNLPPDNWDSLSALAQEFARFRGASLGNPSPVGSHAKYHDDFVECIAVAKAYCNHRGIKPSAPYPEMGSSKEQNVKEIIAWFAHVGSEAKAVTVNRDAKGLLNSKIDEYSSVFAGTSYYEFTDTDYERMQQLISDLRKLITESKLITEDHRRRLLRRLEAMQRELHKKTSDIDRFWGFIGEAGITIRKFGEDMKPISERVHELGRIVIAVILAKEGLKALPEITNLLNLKP